MQSLSYIEISKDNLLHNIATFRRALPHSNSLVAVVKANAYGHGLKEIVTIANDHVDAFQVDDIDELRAIRQYTKKPVYVFGYVLQNDLEEMVSLNGTLGVYNIQTLVTLHKIGQKLDQKIPIHIKIDAFLGRQGILADDVEQWIQLLKSLPHVKVQAVYSHFSNIEDVDDLEHARVQYAELLNVKKFFADAGFHLEHHISATSGLMTNKNNWEGSLVRLGIGMYGLWPSESLRQKLGTTLLLKPVLSWKTHVAQVKTLPADHPVGYGITYRTKGAHKIAVVPQGYSDGFDRGLSNSGEVLIRGTKCTVLGRVAMNMIVVSVDHLEEIELEDEVTIIGTQGSETVSADDIAAKAGTINYEIVARLSALLSKIVT